LFPKPKYDKEGEPKEKVKTVIDIYLWMGFVDNAAGGRILDYAGIYELNWGYLCSILNMKIKRTKEEKLKRGHGKKKSK